MVEPVSTTILLSVLAGTALGTAGFGFIQSKRAKEEAERTARELEGKRIATVRAEVGARAQRLSIIQPSGGRQKSTGFLGEQLQAFPERSVLSSASNRSPSLGGAGGTSGTF